MSELRTREDFHASTSAGPSGRREFAATHWSVVLAAGGDTTRARAGLDYLCRTYWQPLYAYARRRGYSPEDAQDLTQTFFARLLEKNAVSQANPSKGRFRSFLLASMNHFLADEWDKGRAQKRGGGRVVSLDWREAEERLGEMPVEETTPERLFERRWTIALLEEVYRKLEGEYTARGKAELFAILKPTLAGESESAPYAELASTLKLSEAAVKVAVHRLRRRYRELLRETIAETVADRSEVEDELQHLFRTLAAN